MSTTLKTMKHIVKDYVMKDKVDVAIIAIAILVSILDLFTGIDFTGGYAFFTVYMAAAVFRIGHWKWMYKQK